MTIITLRRTRVVGDVMIITTERREMIEITTIVDLITRLNYDNGDDNYEGGKGKMKYDGDDDEGTQKKMKVQ